MDPLPRLGRSEPCESSCVLARRSLGPTAWKQAEHAALWFQRRNKDTQGLHGPFFRAGECRPPSKSLLASSRSDVSVRSGAAPTDECALRKPGRYYAQRSLCCSSNCPPKKFQACKSVPPNATADDGREAVVVNAIEGRRLDEGLKSCEWRLRENPGLSDSIDMYY